MSTLNTLRVGYGPLTDIIIQAAQCHEAAADDGLLSVAERTASITEMGGLIRAAAICLAGGYHTDDYMAAFDSIRDGIDAGVPAGTIAAGLLDRFGVDVVKPPPPAPQRGLRRAVITHATRLDMVRAYLPPNYSAEPAEDGTIVIAGTDNAGWTLDGYVIPRLASGWITATEVTA